MGRALATVKRQATALQTSVSQQHLPMLLWRVSMSALAM